MQFFVVRDKGYKNDIHLFLKQYKTFGGLAVNWRVRAAIQCLFLALLIMQHYVIKVLCRLQGGAWRCFMHVIHGELEHSCDLHDSEVDFLWPLS